MARKDKTLNKIYGKNYHINQRKLVLSALGDKCSCCGESQYEFLSIDHINGGGRQEILKCKGRNLTRLVIAQGIPKDKYQILCHNCNQAKGHYGKCPHNNINIFDLKK